MKLSPPASSSDIDAAREVARRLNLIATPPEPARPLPDYAPLKARDGNLAPPPRRPSAPAWEPAPPSVAPVPPPLSPRPEPPPVAVVDDAPATPEVEEVEAKPNPDLEVEPTPKRSSAPPVVAPPMPVEPPHPVAPEPPPAPLEEVEELEEDMGPDEPIAAIESAVAAPITWPEIVATCLSLAEAKGALVINPEGRVVAVSGDWPAPGAEAIAARLVPAMDKALKDAPTRSVSVPLGGLHLTAWRAPMAQGLVTVGFVADAPLRPDLRPAIDATVRQGGQA